MIEEIAICGLGVIESAEIRPGSGFTALTLLRGMPPCPAVR